MDYEIAIQNLMHRVDNDPDVLGVILYGSYLRTPEFRDIDIALFLDPSIGSKNMITKRLDYLHDFDDIFDIQIYNLLPLVVQHDILKGKVLKETPSMYELAYRTIREFEDFEKYLIQYRESVLDAIR